MNAFSRLAVVGLATVLLSAGLDAQNHPESDEQRRLLEVRRRQVELSAARADLVRAQALFDQGLLSRTDLDRAQSSLERAQLGYQESVLTLLAQRPRLSVREAVKYQAADGLKFVRLVVVNLTPQFDDSQFQLLNNFEGVDPIPETLRRRDVQDVFVSLQSTGEAGASYQAAARGTTIGLPYEVHVPELKYGEARTLTFQLLRDVASVIVVSSCNEQTQEVDIQLQQAETDQPVRITSMQASQEADLGSAATWDLRLERSTVEVRRFELKVLNLPHQVDYSFIDRDSEARLSELTFPAGVSEQTLGLRLHLPERADGDVEMDEPLEFHALVADEREAQRFREDRRYAAEEIEQSRAGRIRLVVTPRGAGRIEVSAASLFSEVRPRETVKAIITIRNTGTRRLDNVKLSADAPIGWRVTLAPDIVPALDINREAAVEMLAEPPIGVPIGDYEIRIRTESYAYNRRVPSEDKVYRVSVKPAANLLATSALVGLLLAVTGTVIVFGVKLTRR